MCVYMSVFKTKLFSNISTPHLFIKRLMSLQMAHNITICLLFSETHTYHLHHGNSQLAIRTGHYALYFL